MYDLLQDIRYGWRALIRSPGFSVTVVATLAIGLGASVAIFAVVNAMMLRPLPYPDSGRMVMVWQDLTRRGGPAREWFTPADFLDLREQTSSFEALAAVGNWRPAMNTGDGAESVPGAIVSAGWFDVVGVHPFIGSAFGADTEVPGADPVVVLGHDLWQRVYGGDAAAVGSTIRLNDVPHRIAGVMPQGFADPLFEADIWRSRILDPSSCGRGCYTIRVIGRIDEGVSTTAAGAEAAALSARLAQTYPENRDVSFTVTGLKEDLLAGTRPALIALAVAVALLLMIAIVNVANLLVARAGVRQRDLAIRTALGAQRTVIIRQMLVETALLGAAGALAGGVISLWALDLLTALAPASTPRIDEVRIDRAALLFTLGAGAVATVMAGLGPALHAARGGLSDVMKEAGGLRTSGSRQRARSALVVAQIAIALILLIGSGLTLKSLVRLQQIDPGFDPDDLVTGAYFLPPARYATDEQIRAFIATALERISSVPGIVSVASTSSLPMTQGDSDLSFAIEGRTPRTDEQPPASWYRMVSPGFFDVMNMRVVDGRAFDTSDRAGDDIPYAAVVNEEFQRRHFPDGAVGGRLLLGPETRVEIIGVVADTRHRGLGETPIIEMFLNTAQVGNRSVTFVMRTELETGIAGAGVRDALRSIDPALPPPAFDSMKDLVAQTIALPRLYSAFFAFFAAVSLLLAAVGVYGLTAYTVGQRRQEIGIRVALGARSADVVGMVVRRSMRLTFAGLAIGLAAAFMLARPLAVLLFDMSAHDAATFMAVPATLAVIAFIASWLPARAAARVDPLKALRSD